MHFSIMGGDSNSGSNFFASIFGKRNLTSATVDASSASATVDAFSTSPKKTSSPAALETLAPPMPVEITPPNQQVIETFNALITILQTTSSPEGSIGIKAIFQSYKQKLPQAMQAKMGDTSHWTHNEWKAFVKHELDLHISEDKGGHGGTMRATVNLNDIAYPLFLKPLDQTEALNYKLIEAFSPTLARHMPTIYGTTEFEGTKYIVMENTRVENGRPLEQLADVKLAGRVKGLFNPIANQNEMLKTRGQNKNWADYGQMALGASVAADYMVAKGPKMLRLANYQSSKSTLQEMIRAANATPEHIQKLKVELREIQTNIANSPFAFIGASIILVKQIVGSIKPILIDPAHMQVSPSFEESILEQEESKSLHETFSQDEKRRIFFGNAQSFKLQTLSNAQAFRQLDNDIVIELAR